MTDKLPIRTNIPPTAMTNILGSELPLIAESETGEVLTAKNEAGIPLDLAELYTTHARELGRIAYLLTPNVQDAEDVVAEVFLNVAERYDLQIIKEPLAFLRAAVVNNSRSVLRRRAVHDRALPRLVPANNGDTTSEIAMQAAEGNTITRALSKLPIRQRQAIVLRYYADLSERDIAATMGVRPGSVKSYTSRGIATLRQVLGPYLQQFM